MTTIRITAAQAKTAIAALTAVANEDGYVTGPDADEVCADLPADVARVIACDADGSTTPTDAWDRPVHIDDLSDALTQATSERGFDLPAALEG